MKRVLAIAVLAVRQAVRSRVVALMLVMLLLVIVGLPLTLKGDGTVGGRVQIILSYTLGFASFLLGLATLWAGCGAVALDVQERQIHLVVTKPVHRFQIWLGKWLGLMVLNATLLGISGLATYGLLLWEVRPGRLTDKDRAALADEILVARRSVDAEKVSVAAEARRRFDEQRAKGLLPAGVPAETVYQAIEQALLNQAYAVAPGTRRQWVFHLPARPPADRPLLFRFRYAASELGGPPIRGLWLVGQPGTPERVEVVTEHVPGSGYTFTASPAVLGGGRNLAVEFANINPTPVTVLFGPDDGLQLLVHTGGFTMNFVRALLVVFARLAFLAALGVTAGSLFSLPVAVFLSLYALILLGAAQFLQELATQNLALVTGWEIAKRSPLAAQVLSLFYKAVYFFIRPLETPEVLAQAATGRLVAWGLAARTWVVQVGLYGGLLAALGMGVLHRRELGLPASAP